MLRIKHPSWDADCEQRVRNVVCEMLLDPRNDQHGVALRAEGRYGSSSFDTYFAHVSVDDLLDMVKEYADDEGDFGLKDFLGTIAEYQMMPCSSLAVRMTQAAQRACR